MKVLIAYDISDNKRLRKVAKFLLGYGNRLQYSIFELDINLMQYQDIQKRLKTMINEKEDRVTYIPLCAQCEKKIETIGAKLSENYLETDFILLVS